MKPLSGLVEINEDLLSKRQNIISENLFGLGPPELICLYKYQVKNTFTSFHHVSGFPMGSENAVQDYFSLLLKSRPKKFLGKVRYEITQSQFCIWNSFSHFDVHVVIKDKNISSVTIENPTSNINNKKKKKKMPTEMNSTYWNELKLSSMLRFWLPQSPIFRSIYNYPYKNSAALRLLPPPNFTDEELQFIVSNHEPSPELEAALACYVISTSTTIKDLQKILTEIILPKLPRVICHFITFFPRSFNINLSKGFFMLANFAYTQLCDDVFLAYSAVNYAIETNDISLCSSAIPVLFNAIWVSPEACCGLAKVSIYKNNASDALYYANAACFTRKFRRGNSNSLEFLLPKLESKKAPRAHPKAAESDLVSSHRTSGHHYLIYRAVTGIASIASSIKIRSMLKSKFGSVSNVSDDGENVSIFQSDPIKMDDKRKQKQHHHSANNSSSYSYGSDYDYDYEYSDSNSGRAAAQKGKSKNSVDLASIFYKDYKEVKNMQVDEYARFCGSPCLPESEAAFLFDPGVALTVPEIPPVLKQLPMNEDFSEISSEALNDIQMRDNIMRNKKFETSQDARKAAIVAMKLCDTEMLDVSLNALKKMKKDTFLLELMRLRVADGKDWSPMTQTEQLSIPKLSLNEYNAMILMSRISKGISNILDDNKNNNK